MKELLNKVLEEGIIVDVKEGELQIFSTRDEVDSNLIAEIKSHKKELISYLNKHNDSSFLNKKYQEIPVCVKNDSYPLSNSQRRLWIASQIEEMSVAYNRSDHIVLDGTYDMNCFQKAIYSVIERHEILRTVFKMDESEEPRQYILSAEELNFAIEIQDFRNEDDPKKACESYMILDAQKPFDLERGPLLRASLLQLSDDINVFYYNMHHIIGDGWSSNVLSSDVMKYYKAYISQVTPNLPKLKIQYKDYSVWQLNQLNSATLQKSKDYWRAKLQGNLPIIDLPTSKRRPQIKTYDGKKIGTHIPSDIIEKLQNFTKEREGSLFTGLSAICFILIYKYTGETDIVIGNPIAGRDHPDLEDQIGFYVNTLALRNKIDPNHNFIQIFDQINKNSLKAYQHQLYPFDQLVEDLNLLRDTSRNPIFDFLINHSIASENNSSFGNEKELLDLGNSKIKFDVEFDFTEVNGGINFVVNYNQDVYEDEMIKQFVLHFKGLLEQILNNTKESIGEIDFFNDKEKKKLLLDFNNTQVNLPKDETIVDLFVKQAKETPDAIALVFEEQELTYQKLDKKSNQLALYLQKQGVTQGALVPICIERSIEMIVGILGIIKAGAAYVPIDVTNPLNRVKVILDDINAKLILTESTQSKIFETIRPNLQTILLDKLPKIDKESTSSYAPKVSPSDLAYIIYTSGSTGDPKGVMVEHRSVFNHILHHSKEFDINTSDNILLFSNFAFDASVEQIFLALTNGSSLVLIDKEALLDSNLFKKVLNENEVTHLHATPSYLNHLPFDNYKALKRVVAGGEYCPSSLAELWGSRYIFYNEYGPTETTITSVEYKYDPKDSSLCSDVSIGRPISNTQVYIFDSNLNIVPIGVVGELCISGAGLAQGYYNSPELTAEKFIDHPFEEGLKLYKTGDFARWLPSGDLQFIGRKDHQVKIRGYRIELGEIESALARIESIEQSVVLAREDGNGLKQLVAYIVSKGEVNHVITEQKLKEHLPEYMIPKIYVSIDQIPLTKNGKIDHKALPNFDQSAYNKKEYVAPSSDTEIKLTEIWEQVLKIEKIGVRDDFFDLGGNSLIAVRLTGRYNKIFNKKITIKEIFANPVLEDHVDLIKTSSDETYMEIKKVENSESYPLSNAQYRLWLVSQVEEGSIAYNMPNTIILNGEYNVNYFQKAIYHVIDRHEILRTIFKTNESGEVRQFVQSAEDFDLVIDIKDYREKNDPKLACESYVLSDSTRPFDLEKGPLFRASLLQLSDNQYVFYYNMHHIIGDGWSKSILSNDVMKYYEAYVTGTISDIPTLRIQYKDYTVWQLEQFKDPKFQYSKNYWSSQLSGELPILNLPSQKKRPRIKTYQGHKIGTRISSDLTEQLQSFAAERRGGFFSAISAVCNVLIYRYTGETDIIFGNPVAGRDHPDLEDQIGFYINILALRNKISPNHSFIDFFDQVNETILKAYEHQLYPFDRLIEDLKLQRDTSRNALFDLWINYHETSETGISFENDNEVRDLGNGIVKFDIEFDFIKVKDGVDFVISYNKDIYEQEMIERFILHFKILLKQLLDHPDQSISNVEFLIEDEKKKLLYDFNNFKEDYPKNQTVVDQFRERAKKTPDAIALIFEGSELTYQDLDDKSDQLAHYLLSQGVQKESLIPICIDRSLEMIIGILGILKAGGAYVPVDSGYPLQRIKFIIEDIDAKMILTQTTLSKIFEDNQSSIQIINLDQLPETNNKLIKNVLNKIITPSQLAYIIYTSGTTGRPKGVMITHSSLLDYATTFNNYFGVSQSDRVLQQASISFDISVEEIFPILIKGGSLYISKEINDFEKLIKICEKEEITILSTHPYLIQFMNENFHEEELPLRVLISGGDTLKKEFVSNIANRYNIFNTYGPTESTVCASYAKIGINDLVISIGKPIANKQVYILSDEESLQPMGITGELCIGGAGLAKGYLNLPGLTSKKFIPHPFKDGEKIYKTGDLARWLPDGNIEFLGRKDDQVKIMGYRIELGEIESVLDQQKDIQQSYVMVSEDNDSKYLVAYIVCDGESDVSIIQQNLRGIIPEYMVPKVFITLDEMPLTPNGKVDRKSLPNPVIGGNQEYVGPSSVTEIQLTRIWQEALDIDKISIHDNFFDLGGNSLSAIKIILQMRKELDIEVDIKSLFDTNTIADLALQIDFSINQEEIRSESKIVKQIM